MREKLLKKIEAERKKFALSELALRIGVSKRALYHFVSGDRGGRIDTWEKIAAYFQKKGHKGGV